MHAVAPAEPWYVPTAQATHSSLRATALNVPGLQGVASVAPAKQNDPAGQAVHCVSTLSPGTPLYVPARHGSGADAPLGQYDPNSHSEHAVCPAPG